MMTSMELHYKRHNPQAVKMTVKKEHRMPDVFLLRCSEDAIRLANVCAYNNAVIERL